MSIKKSGVNQAKKLGKINKKLKNQSKIRKKSVKKSGGIKSVNKSGGKSLSKNQGGKIGQKIGGIQ